MSFAVHPGAVVFGRRDREISAWASTPGLGAGSRTRVGAVSRRGEPSRHGVHRMGGL